MAFIEMSPLIETFLNVISLALYIFDVGSDILLALSFYNNGDTWYFTLTLFFILLSTIVINTVSFVISLFDDCEDNFNDLKKYSKYRLFVVLRLIVHCSLMGVIYRYIWAICDGLRLYHKQKNSEFTIVGKPVTIRVLSLLEIFLEAGPQLILHLYIIIVNTQVIRPEFQTDHYIGISKRNSTGLITDADFFQQLTSTTMMYQTVSILTSVFSIAWVLTKNSHQLRRELTEVEMSWISIGCHFVWHVFTVGARIFAPALFASAFTYWIVVALAFRCLVIGGYFIYVTETELSELKFWKNMLLFVVRSFTYFDFNPKPQKKLFVFTCYYFVEGSVLVGIWSLVIDPVVNNFVYLVLIIYYTCVVLGFVFMVIYLKCFHPHEKVEIGKNHSELSTATTVNSNKTFYS